MSTLYLPWNSHVYWPIRVRKTISYRIILLLIIIIIAIIIRVVVIIMLMIIIIIIIITIIIIAVIITLSFRVIWPGSSALLIGETINQNNIQVKSSKMKKRKEFLRLSLKDVLIGIIASEYLLLNYLL